jgi:prolyl-tRNA synthetase
MRLSRFPLSTTRETPSDAEVISHQLLLRAGFIRKLGAGLYTWMPIGLRVMKKVENIVREEMNRAGALEVLMPTIQPAELWQESGRWDTMGPEMLRIKDRHKNEFCYAPTAEEVITHHVKQDIRSYRQLPVNYYQIQIKFRDERRPRFGLMRGREFLMKDAYSFHMNAEDLSREYYNMRDAYTRIFTRVGVEFRAVKADSGNIGGALSEEFHILAGSGEDLLAVAEGGTYAANVEAAETPRQELAKKTSQLTARVETPGKKSNRDVAEFLNVDIKKTLKCIAVVADGKFYLLAVRGDREVNEVKVRKLPGLKDYVLATEEEIVKRLGSRPGFIGPVILPDLDQGDAVATHASVADLTAFGSLVKNKALSVIADYEAAAMIDFVCGANEKNMHVTGMNWGDSRCMAPGVVEDIRMIAEGDPSPDGVGTIKFYRGIEGGHVFQLGQKYSKAMNLTVLDEKGQAVTPEMGCYGIGVSRMVAAVLEQSHDANGMIWPDSIAPFRVIICPIGMDKSEAVKTAAEKLYADLNAAGIEVALDDRGARPGSMFADADLIGIPHRIVIGDKSLANTQFEYKHRKAASAEMIPATSAAVLEKLGG